MFPHVLMVRNMNNFNTNEGCKTSLSIVLPKRMTNENGYL